MNSTVHRINADCVSISVDASIYSPTAIKEATNRHADKLHCSISHAGNGGVTVHIRAKPGSLLTDVDLELAARDLLNSMLDQQVRLDLASRNQQLKETIIKQAFEPVARIPTSSS
jgi:His-Xaa-Ser system protein HxsD